MKIPKSKVLKSQTVTVTPTIATEWLDPETVNTHNRGLSKDTVQRYAADMESGNWFIGEPIMFDSEGVLIDGQHRLAAIVESGAAQEMLVVTGCDPDVRLMINTGKGRNPQDALKIAGVSVRNASVIVGIARMALLWERGGLATIPSNGGMTFPNWEIVNWVIDHPEVEDFAMRGRTAARELKTNAQSFGFALYLFEQIDLAAAKEFETNLVEHVQAGKTDPLFLLREGLDKIAATAGKGQGLRHHQHIAILVLAWNRWRKLDKSTGPFTHQSHLEKIEIGAPMPIPG